MNAHKIIQNGNLVGMYTALDGKRYIYKLNGEYASCLEGGLSAMFEIKEEIVDFLNA